MAALIMLCVSGCTVYEPVRSPRVAVVKSAFRRGLVRDGHYYPGGYFGGNVEEAVKGVPEAEAHTRAYATWSTIGSIALFTSEAAAIAGSPIIAATTDDHDTSKNAHIGLIIGSVTLLVSGIVMHLAAEPHLYDAANLYNDAIDRGWRPESGAAPPPPGEPLSPGSPGPRDPATR